MRGSDCVYKISHAGQQSACEHNAGWAHWALAKLQGAYCAVHKECTRTSCIVLPSTPNYDPCAAFRCIFATFVCVVAHAIEKGYPVLVLW